MRRITAALTILIGLTIAGLAWAQISIEGQIKALLDGWVSKPPGTFTAFKYGAANYDIASRKVILENLEFSGGPPEKIEKLLIQRAELVDFNPAAIAKIADKALYKDGKGDGAFVRIVGDAFLQGVAATGATDRIIIREFKAQGVQGRQFDVAPGPDFPREEGGKAFALIAGAFKAEQVVFADVEIRGKQGNGMNIGRFSVWGLDAGKVGSVSLERSTAIEQDLESVTFGLISMRGLDVSRMLPDLAAGRGVAMRDPARKPDIDELRVTGITGPMLAAEGLKLGEIQIAVTRSADRMSDRTVLRMTGFELSRGTKPDGDMGKALSMVGYTSVPMEWVCEGSNDYGKQIASVDRCDLTAQGAATLSLTYALGNLGSGEWGNDQGAAMAALMGYELHRLRIVLRDQSLLERLLAFAAQMEGKTAQAKRAELVQQVRLGSAGFTQGSPRLQQAVQAVVAFMEKPGSLTIEFTPAQPVKFGEFNMGMMADPPAVAEKLGLKVTSAP